MKQFGQRVRDGRKALGLTQAQFCTRCGIVTPYLSRIEGGRGNPSLTVLVAIAQTLGAQPSDLLRD